MRLVIAVLSALMSMQPIQAPEAVAPETWVSSSDYPPEALRQGWEGVVSMELKIDETGRILACAIIHSSGYSDLDQNTCNLIMARGSFKPAKDRDGNAVPSAARRSIRWAIPKDGPDTMVVVSQGKNGPECVLQTDVTKVLTPTLCLSLADAIKRSGQSLPTIASVPVPLGQIQPRY